LMIVTKFGGSSLADAAQFQKVRDIMLMNSERKYIVPSAPGKRGPGDDKITDLLYACHQAAAAGKAFRHTLERIRARYIEIADELIKRDKRSKVLSKYFMGAVTIEEVKVKLRIDEVFEFKFFGIKPKVDHKTVVINFAIQNGYAEREEKVSHDLIENIIISGNEEIIERYNSGEISDEQFETELGIKGFAEMFFDISKVDISSIEENLLEVKKTTAGRKKIENKMIVLLYCYVVFDTLCASFL